MVDKLESRVVAKGYDQVPGFNFKGTFSPIVKHVTIRVFITLALKHKWKLHQLDINDVFLNGVLTEEVYMSQTLGFAYSNYPSHCVCKLQKAIYASITSLV